MLRKMCWNSAAPARSLFVVTVSFALERITKACLHGSLPVFLSDFTECGVGVVRVGSIPVRMIREIERIEPEGQRLSLEGWEAFQNRRIEVSLSWSPENIADMLGRKGTGGWRG